MRGKARRPPATTAAPARARRIPGLLAAEQRVEEPPCPLVECQQRAHPVHVRSTPGHGLCQHGTKCHLRGNRVVLRQRAPASAPPPRHRPADPSVSLPISVKKPNIRAPASNWTTKTKHTPCHHRPPRELPGPVRASPASASRPPPLAPRCARRGRTPAARPSTLGDVAADDVERAAARAGRHGHRQSAVQRDAAVEAHQLHRDLALVVVHRHHRVEVAAARGEEHGVGRQRSAGVDAFAARALDRGRDDVDLLAADASRRRRRAD